MVSNLNVVQAMNCYSISSIFDNIESSHCFWINGRGETKYFFQGTNRVYYTPMYYCAYMSWWLVSHSYQHICIPYFVFSFGFNYLTSKCIHTILVKKWTDFISYLEYFDHHRNQYQPISLKDPHFGWSYLHWLII